MPPHASPPIYANFPSEKLTIGAGVAIFHLATERVIVCYHSRDKPKGRKDANETTERAAEREGFEESGYRNRILPLPMSHRQPNPDGASQRFVKEAIWTQFLPLTATSQYVLFWYAAETLPPDLEQQYRSAQSSGSDEGASHVYRPPQSFPPDVTLKQRIAEEKSMDDVGSERTVYEPKWHPGTGVDEEERMYRSFMLSIPEARRKLKGSVMEDVVRRGWEAIGLRMKMEEEGDA